MIKEIQQRIRQSQLLDKSEPILSLVQVIDYYKSQQQLKKLAKDETAAALVMQNNTYYLLASIRAANDDSTPVLYLVKADDKTSELKLKGTWQLGEIRVLAALDHNVASSAPSFLIEMEMETMGGGSSSDAPTKTTWKCEGRDERTAFLTTLWKLAEQFLQAFERPEFRNFAYEGSGKASAAKDLPQQSDDGSGSSSGSGSGFEISKSEEESLMKLMAECNFASANADNFMQRLQAELLVLDTANIESIMNSEENTIKLIEMLDEAVVSIERIDARLKDYEDKISAVGDAVRVVGERDNVIQTQQINQHALLDLLDEMLSGLEFPRAHIDVLNACDLSSEAQIRRCVTAANGLLEIVRRDFPAGLRKMKAHEEQMKALEMLKMRFCSRASSYMKNQIGHVCNEHLKSYTIVDNSLTSLPSHKAIHADLVKFGELMSWLARSGCSFNDQDKKTTYFDDIKANYLATMSEAYEREIGPFCHCARAKIIKNDRQKANSSMENLKVFRSLDKSHASDFFSVKIDQSTKETLKLVFIKLMNQLSETAKLEQAFCHEFFAGAAAAASATPTVSGKQQMTSSTATNVSLSDASKQSDSKLDLVILNGIFGNRIELEVRSIIECTIKTENLMVIFVYSDLLYRVLVSHNQRQYMHQPLVSLLRLAKEKCDEFTGLIKSQIREYKVNKKEKIGLLRYVLYFEEFVKEAEVCWEPIKEKMYEKLCIIYQMIVDEIFKGIDTIANESQKTPPDVVKFQNYHHMQHIMRSINGLKESTKYAKDQYASARQNYVKEHFGRPLEKLSAFFDKVQQRLDRGIRHEDISYQFELSANNLRDIIREYPAKEVKKGLDNLYNKMQKHLVENSNLVNVVWRDMTDEFLRQYQNYEQLIRTCYPNQRIALEFTEQDVCMFFQDIAQSH